MPRPADPGAYKSHGPRTFAHERAWLDDRGPQVKAKRELEMQEEKKNGQPRKEGRLMPKARFCIGGFTFLVGFVDEACANLWCRAADVAGRNVEVAARSGQSMGSKLFNRCWKRRRVDQAL